MVLNTWKQSEVCCIWMCDDVNVVHEGISHESSSSGMQAGHGKKVGNSFTFYQYSMQDFAYDLCKRNQKKDRKV